MMTIFFRWLVFLWLAAVPWRGVLAEVSALDVVASFSIVGDMVQRVGGERVRVHLLVGPDADAHVYQPTPADARKVAQARLVVVNGLNYEGWITRLVRAAGYRGDVVRAAEGVQVLRSGGDTHGHGHGHEEADPHAWQDLKNARRYVENIRGALVRIDPAGKAVYDANASGYLTEMDQLDAEIRTMIGRLPADRRTVITSHDSFAYFSRAYGIRFVAPVGVSTEAAASAADVGKLIRQVRKEKIPAIFMENVSDPRLLERIRAETGAKVGGTLYSDALSKSAGAASSYLAMMRHNAATLATALAP